MDRARAALVAGLSGAAVMTLELTAVRLLAPHFGDSAFVWTNAIGVMLVALAAGAFAGGRIADGGSCRQWLSGLFLSAAGLCAVVPLVSGPLGGWLLPQDLPLDTALPAVVRGSLVATLVLFAPPVVFLGAVSPLIIAELARRDGRIGRAAGMVGGVSTLGSLVGTFMTTHYLVPGLGSRGTVWLAAGLLLLCAVLLVPGRKVLLFLLLPALWALPLGPMRPPAPGFELLAEQETAYQFLQVVRDGEGAVFLKINEGLDSFHSVALPDTAFTGGRYYDFFAAVPFLIGEGQRPDRLRVLSLGAAAGTFNRLFAHCFPGCSVDAVEIDGATVALGEQHFGGRPARGEVFEADARVFVECTDRTYELILVDAYERQVYIPAHVASREFFAAAFRRLVPGGAVAINVGGHDHRDPVPAALGWTMAEVFGKAWAFKIPRSRNLMLVARRAAAVDPVVLRDLRSGDRELDRVLAAVAEDRAWAAWERGAGEALRDDRPVLDSLLEESLALPETDPGLTVMAGAVAPQDAERLATLGLRAGNGRGALATLRTARAATPRLRSLAAGARWLLRDLEGARREYRAALAGAVDDPFRNYVQQQLERLAAATRTIENARGLAWRNGALAFGVALALLALGWLAWRRIPS